MAPSVFSKVDDNSTISGTPARRAMPTRAASAQWTRRPGANASSDSEFARKPVGDGDDLTPQRLDADLSDLLDHTDEHEDVADRIRGVSHGCRDDGHAFQIAALVDGIALDPRRFDLGSPLGELGGSIPAQRAEAPLERAQDVAAVGGDAVARGAQQRGE